tara:strand:+ start:10128 stop:11453 length:1326 start_codon:yes stop_codon:yes gene_type:complete
LLIGIKNFIMSNLNKLHYSYKKSKIAVIGLGYVGLPLAVEFAKIRDVIGFDQSLIRINELNKGIDKSLEISSKEIKSSKNLAFTNNLNDIKDCQIFIVTVPTPIDEKNKPDLSLLKKSCMMIGSLLKKGDLVIYESTVYPGVTEEICAPILQKESGLVFNIDFYCGYSSERINPGDKDRRLTMIKKVTSGSTPEISIEVDNLYNDIIKAGTHKAPSIKIAEAAKVIENIQRDVNIALINELAIIFNKLNIDTKSVLDAASTKWNFIHFKPGLVGGHCISVDPYYLLHKSLEVGYKPEMITAGRKVNNFMGSYIVERVINLMSQKGIKISNSNILIMGFTFKENCPDIRNTRVIDLVRGFHKHKLKIDVFDSFVKKNEILNEYDINLVNRPISGKYDAIILAVAHDEFKKLSLNEIKKFGKKNSVIYDIKYLLNHDEVDGRI